MAINNYLLFSKTTSSNGRRGEIEDGGYKGFMTRAEEEGWDVESYDCLINTIQSLPQSS